MKTDYVIDDTMVGQVVGPMDGFLVSLRQTQAQARYAVPDGDDGSGVWKSGFFVLKGSRDHQAIYSNCPSQCGSVDPGKVWVANASIGYRGELQVVACPKGLVWSLTLSDVPNIRSAAAWSPSTYANWLLDRQAELVTR
jgi:hypothetical protein